jgi:hypothetical protein
MPWVYLIIMLSCFERSLLVRKKTRVMRGCHKIGEDGFVSPAFKRWSMPALRDQRTSQIHTLSGTTPLDQSARATCLV